MKNIKSKGNEMFKFNILPHYNNMNINKAKYNSLLYKYNETDMMNQKYKNNLVELKTPHKYNLLQQEYKNDNDSWT